MVWRLRTSARRARGWSDARHSRRGGPRPGVCLARPAQVLLIAVSTVVICGTGDQRQPTEHVLTGAMPAVQEGRRRREDPPQRQGVPPQAVPAAAHLRRRRLVPEVAHLREGGILAARARDADRARLPGRPRPSSGLRAALLLDGLRGECLKDCGLSRHGGVEEVAALAAWLAFENACVTGQTMMVDGGL